MPTTAPDIIAPDAPQPRHNLLPAQWRDDVARIVYDHMMRTGQTLIDHNTLRNIVHRSAGPATALGDIAHCLRRNIAEVLAMEGMTEIAWYELLASQMREPNVDVEALRAELEFRENFQPTHKQVSLVNDYGNPTSLSVTCTSIGTITNEYKRNPAPEARRVQFKQIYLEVNDAWCQYVVLWYGATNTQTRLPVIDRTKPVMLRIDSGCHSGMVCGDTECDCHQQLTAAKHRLVESDGGQGLVIHIMGQDGRGMGGDFKNATLEAQLSSRAANTVVARLMACSHNIDARTYDGAVAVLRFLDIGPEVPIILLTNNTQGKPEFDVNSKTGIFALNGYTCESQSISIPLQHLHHHYRAKNADLGHNIHFDSEHE